DPRTHRSNLFPYTTLFRSWWVKDYPIPSDQLVHHIIAITTSEGDTQHKLELHIPQPPLALGMNVPLSECLTFRFLFYREPGSERSEEHTSELQSRVDLVCR